MHYICTANKGVKVHIEMRSVLWKSIHCIFIYWICPFFYCVMPKICSMLLSSFWKTNKFVKILKHVLVPVFFVTAKTAPVIGFIFQYIK